MHQQISRTVEEIPAGVRTTTQSDSPDLAAQLHAHVSSMYSHVDQGAEVSCMSSTLPTLFRNASGYRRQLTLTPTGVITEETADDPALTETIRAHASTEEISLAVWGRRADTNTIAVHVKRLREKLGSDPEYGEFIRTIRGAGYRLAPSICA